MYDKKQALGFILIIMVVMTYTQMVFAPNQQPAQQSQNNQALPPSTQINTQTSSLAPNSNPSNQNVPVLANQQARIPSISEVNQAEKSIIHTGTSVITISHLGGRIKSLELSNIKKDLHGTESLNLIEPIEGLSLPGGLISPNFSDEGLKYEIKEQQGLEKKDQENYFVQNNSAASLTLTASSPSGYQVVKTFEFKANSYLFNIKGQISGANSSSENLSLIWPIHVNKEALSQRYDPYFFSFLSSENKVKHTPAASDLKDLSKPQAAKWMSFGDRYFAKIFLPTSPQQTVKVDSYPDVIVLNTQGGSSSVNVGIFAGPKNYQVLKSFDLQLERTVDLGFFAIVAYPLLQLLKFLYSIFGNYGVAIVALTLLIKTIFYPLNKASLKSMRAMQELSPEIAALRERVKDSAQLNQEMLALYKRKGVNPMGGCFPVLIQIPVFFGLYSSLQNVVELRHAPFALWVKDLATPERLPINLSFAEINFPVMIITMGVIMFIQQYRTPMPNMEPAQRKMMLGMSLMFTFMFLIFPFPAGLALYMLVNTTISMVQQQCIKSQTMTNPFRMTLAASAAILIVSFVLSKI